MNLGGNLKFSKNMSDVHVVLVNGTLAAVEKVTTFFELLIGN